MVTEDLLNYIRSQLDKGTKQDVLKKALQENGGWSEADVKTAFEQLDAAREASDNRETGSSDAAHASTDTPAASESQVATQQSQSEPESTGTASSEPVRESHLLRNTLLFLLLIAAIAAAVFAYVYLYLGIGRHLTPPEVLARSVVAHQEISTVRENGDATLKISLNMPVAVVVASSTSTSTPDEGEEGATTAQVSLQDITHNITLDLGYDAVLDTTSPDAVKGSLALVAKAKGVSDLFSFNFDLDVNSRYVDKKLYLRVNDMTRTWLAFDPTAYLGEWIVIDTERFASEIGINIDTELADRVREYHRLTTELARIALDPDIVDLLSERIVELTDSEVTESPNYQYAIQLSADDWEMLMRAMFEALATDEAASAGMDLEALRAELDSKRFNNLYAWLAGLRTNISINKETFLISEVNLEWSISDATIDGGQGSLTIDARSLFSGYGDPVEIRVPSSPIPVEDVLAAINVPLATLTPGTADPSGPLPYQSGFVWVGTDPVQCLGNPWEQDWLQQFVPKDGGEGVVTQPAYPQDDPLVIEAPEAEIIRSYYERLSIEIRSLKSYTYEEKFGEDITVCAACECAQGYSLYLQVPSDQLEQMIDLGWQIADI